MVSDCVNAYYDVHKFSGNGAISIDGFGRPTTLELGDSMLSPAADVIYDALLWV